MNIGGFELDLAQVATLLAALGTLAGQARLRIGQRAKADKIDAVAHEVKPNGGASLRDAVDRIESLVTDLAARVAHLEQTRTRSFWRR